MRGVYAAVLEMAGHQGTAVDGAQHHHNDRYVPVLNTNLHVNKSRWIMGMH